MRRPTFGGYAPPKEGTHDAARTKGLTIIAFYLLATAATASAECAWVLWATYKTNQIEHAIERALESQGACERAIPQQVQSQLKTWRGMYEQVNVSPADPAMVVAKGVPESAGKSARGDTLIVRVSCWPLGLQPKSVTGDAEYPKGDSR